MGEAKRRKLAGNVEPNPKYRKVKKISNRKIDQMAEAAALQFMMRTAMMPRVPLLLRRNGQQGE